MFIFACRSVVNMSVEHSDGHHQNSDELPLEYIQENQPRLFNGDLAYNGNSISRDDKKRSEALKMAQEAIKQVVDYELPYYGE